MTLDEFKDVLQLNKLAISWIKDYTDHNIGVYSQRIKKQYKDMKTLVSKTEQLIEKQTGDTAIADKDWKSSYELISDLAKNVPAYLSCFGDTEQIQDKNAPVSKETAMLAIQLKKLTSSWYGRFADEVQDNHTTGLIAALHDRSKEILAAPKTTDGDSSTLVFYGSKSKRCRKMRKTIEFIGDEYEGLLNIEQHIIKDEDKMLHKLNIESLPTVVFKRGNKNIATHKGLLSISATEQKVGILLDGANFSDSSSVKSIKDMKSVNQKELYNIGEYLLFYFESPRCGLCKEITPIVEKYANFYSKVAFEKVSVDGSHSLHKSFGVTEVPSLVFVHDGKVIGKHVGDINPSSLEKLLEKFAVSNKRKIGLSRRGNPTVVDQEAINDQKKKKQKIKNRS